MEFNKESSINSDLTTERKSATFNLKELTTLLDGSEEDTKERHDLERLFANDPNIPNPFSLLHLSFDDYYKQVVKSTKYTDDLINRGNFPGQYEWKNQNIRAFYIKWILCPSVSPTTIHNALFLPTISRQGTDEQYSYWFGLVNDGKVFGTIAQTELGHGSDVRHLETTATYDPITEEFIMNSPSTMATKCWASGLGRTANHAIVLAQLYSGGKCYGLHLFIVQIRDFNTHSSMPGCVVGELGPKMGMPGADNGFLHLNQVRIPRGNMLMKNAKILEDSTYIKPKFDRDAYGMMVHMRCVVVNHSALMLAQICTIAVRYSAIRRQGKKEIGGADVKILDYQTQQFKLFPQVALSYALFFSSRRLLYKHLENTGNEKEEDLKEFHSLAAGMKALSTHWASIGGEVCRQACGAMGYLQVNRLPALCTNIIASCTYEGDNTVLRLQTARHLMKSVKMIEDRKPIGKSVEYLKKEKTTNHTTCMTEFLCIFEVTAANFIGMVANKIKHDVQLGRTQESAWQNNTVSLAKCAELHIKQFVMETTLNLLTETQMSASLSMILGNLFQLLAIFWIQENSGDYIMYGRLSADKISELNSRIPHLLNALRPDIVSLVDSFDFSDAALQSPIGCYDGRAYDRLLEHWSCLPANKKQNNKLFMQPKL